MLNLSAEKYPVIALCRELVKRKSFSGSEKELVEYLQSFLQENGFDEVYTDENGSLTGIINGDSEGPTILFDGHLDTVPVTLERWKHNPFEGIIENNRMYGRGTSDMKGAIAAFISAIVQFTREHHHHFPGRLAVSLTTFEETFEGIAARLISERVKPDYVVIGEATNLNLNVGQRGRAEIVCETFGVPVHSANPEKGVNAVYSMLKLIDAIQKLPVDCSELGIGIFALTDIISNPYPGASVIPSNCRVTFDRRLLVGETEQSVLSTVEKLISNLGSEDKAFKAKVYLAQDKGICYTGKEISARKFFPAWLFDKQENYITAILERFKKDAVPIQLSTYSFCTNGSHYAGEKNIKTLGYGPSIESLAHVDDEYIELDQLCEAVKGNLRIIEALQELPV